MAVDCTERRFRGPRNAHLRADRPRWPGVPVEARSILRNTSLFSKTPVNCHAPGPLADSGTSDAVWPVITCGSGAVSAGQRSDAGHGVAPFSITPGIRNPGIGLPATDLLSELAAVPSRSGLATLVPSFRHRGLELEAVGDPVLVVIGPGRPSEQQLAGRIGIGRETALVPDVVRNQLELLIRLEAEHRRVVAHRAAERLRHVAVVADADQAESAGLVIGGDDDQRVVGRIAIAVGPRREVERHLDRAIELDHVPDHPLRVGGVRALVDRRALDHQIEAGR